jgi:hypothetical protein
LPRFENVAFGVDRLRGYLDQFIGEFGGTALHFGFEACDTRSICSATGADFTQFGGKSGVVDLHEDLALLHDRAFMHQNFPDDAAFEALQDLNLPRRDNAPVTPFDLIEFGEMCPDHACRHQGDDRHEKSARRPRRAKLRRRADIVDESEVRLLHSFPPAPVVGKSDHAQPPAVWR